MNVTCTKNKDPKRAIDGSCKHTLPAGLTLYAEYGSNAVGDFGPLLNATAKSGNLAGTGAGKNISDLLVDAGITRFTEPWRRYESPEVFECRLTWCAKRYSKVNVTKGEIVTPDTRIWPLKPPSAAIRGEDGILLGHFTVDENTNLDGPGSNFTVNAKEHSLLADWLTSKIFTNSERDAVGRVLYTQPNISQTFTNIATSMTNRVREGSNATKVLGTSHREEIYIHVTCPWLILPGVVVLMSVVLLIASINLSRRDRQGLWKNTTLAPLFTQMRGWEHEELRAGRWSEMANQTKGMRARLRRDGQGGLDFVRA